MGQFLVHEISAVSPKDRGRDTNETPKLVATNNQIIVHGADGPFLMDKRKWPTLSLPDEGDKGLTQEDSLMDNVDNDKEVTDGVGLAREQGLTPIHNSIEEVIMDSISIMSKDSMLDEESQGW